MFSLEEEMRKLKRHPRVVRMWDRVVDAVDSFINGLEDDSGFDGSAYKLLDEDKLIPDFHMPQVDRIYQPGGKGTTLVVEMPPNCALARRLRAEVDYRYMVVFDYTEHDLDYEKANPSRIEALREYLDGYPGIKGSVSAGHTNAGSILSAANGVVEMDFVVIAPDGKYHLERFTDEQVGHICTRLNIPFYQTKK